MTTIKEVFFGYVRDIPDTYELINLSQDIRSVCEYIGLNYDDYAGVSFFIDIGDGDYNDVLYCNRSVPYLDEIVYRILVWSAWS